MNIKSAITILLLYCSSVSLHSTTPHSITVDGDLSDWKTDELIYDDPANDGAWGSLNQVDNLYLTWDNSNLYIGASGVQKDGNCFVLYIDVGTGLGFGDYSDVSKLKDTWGSDWWWARNHKFPQNFLPDYQLHLYEMQLKLNEGHGLFRYTTSSQTVSVLLSSSAYTGGGTGKSGNFEAAIPWSTLYPDHGGGVPKNAVIKLVAVMSGGNDTGQKLLGSAHDSAPDQTANFTAEWYGQFTFDTWLTIPIDQNKDGVPDINRSTVERDILVIPGDKTAFLSWQKKGYWEKNLLGYKLYYQKEKFSGGFSLAGANSIFVGDTTNYVLTGLENNNTYYFVLTAIDKNNVESGASEEAFCRIHGPTLVHTPLKKFSYPGKGISLSATVTDSSGIETVKLYYMPSGRQYYSVENLVLQNGRYSFTIPAEIVNDSIDYYFRAENKNGDVNISSSTIAIVSTNSATYSPDAQLELSLPDVEGAVTTKIVIPQSASDRKIKIVAESKPISDVIDEPTNSEFLDTVPVCVYEFYAMTETGEKSSTSFLREAEISLRYFDDDLNSNFSESSLRPFLWTGVSWVSLRNATIDTQSNFVKAKTGHISKFAVFYAAEETTENAPPRNLKKIIRPKFVPNAGEVIEFDVTTTPEKIEIFNLKGEKIRKIEGLNFWDGRDEYNNIVSAGVYIYQLHFADKTISGSCVVIK